MKVLMLLKVKLLFPDGPKSVLSAKFETLKMSHPNTHNWGKKKKTKERKKGKEKGHLMALY
jgi:hypothetical protein